MAKWLEEHRPTLTAAQINTVCRRVIPQVGQQITADLKWSEDDIRIVNQRADPTSNADTQHEDMVADPGAETAQKLYKVCLRMWHRFPTEIICPNTGLVFGSEFEPDIQPKLVEMRWSRKFNEVLTKIVAHNAWGDEFHLMVAAIRFACICYGDDRRPWKFEAHGDPFFETFLLCQDKNPDTAKKDLFGVIEKRLKKQQQWPSKSFQIFKSIASILGRKCHEDNDDDDNDDDNMIDRIAPEP
ncbi:hypothetical protein F5B21DRAFT_521909 [Xylaria acuta]|nr:hypothetical protein F5B21DRAFT_521909 [Xylaria acuta]